MKKLIVVPTIFLLLMVTGYGGVRLRFVDLGGKPILGVTVSFSYVSTPPAPPVGGGSVVSDVDGVATINHPCFFLSRPARSTTSRLRGWLMGRLR